MFSQFTDPGRTRRSVVLGVSLGLHLLFLAWVLRSPAPIFIAPVSMAKGMDGKSLTRIYFGGDQGITQERPQPKVRLPRSSPPEKQLSLPPIPARMKAGNEVAALAHREGPAAGSDYGSLSVGSFYGSEVRPALPVVSPDPAIDPEISRATQGDIVVEITIDEAGNIVEKRVLQSLGPAIDQTVMATLERWHFMAATRNGVPIPSKQDVYYHFPR